MDSLGSMKKVVFVMGATGTGKSKLSVDLALRFFGEIVNSDKIQVYKGLDVVTNKVTKEEQDLVPHHLLGVVEPDSDFNSSDFCLTANHAIESIISRGKIPIIAGGSNSFLEALVDDENLSFRSKYKCCFLWINVSLPLLHSVVVNRVDSMVEAGLVEEVRGVFDPNADYTRGIRRAIGVPEMDVYFRKEAEAKADTRASLLKEAIEEIKANTCKLTCRQVEKIYRLHCLPGWDIHLLDATDVYEKRGAEMEAAWEKVVGVVAAEIVRDFLSNKEYDLMNLAEEVKIESMVGIEKDIISSFAFQVAMESSGCKFS